MPTRQRLELPGEHAVLIHALLLSLALASPAPSPAASQPAVAVCNCLAGITIGDDATSALAKVGSRPVKTNAATSVLSDYESYPGWMLAIYYAKTVVAVAISAQPPGAPTKEPDPFGVVLGDSPDRLTALRGKPDAVDGTIWRYGPVDGLRWLYSVENGAVARIAITSLPPA